MREMTPAMRRGLEALVANGGRMPPSAFYKAMKTSPRLRYGTCEDMIAKIWIERLKGEDGSPFIQLLSYGREAIGAPADMAETLDEIRAGLSGNPSVPKRVMSRFELVAAVVARAMEIEKAVSSASLPL